MTGNVYTKLQQLRTRLLQMNLRKNGENKHTGAKYFELGDFIPHVLPLCQELGLCSVISFDTEFARLNIVNVDKPDDRICITSPMAEANMKANHAIQNLGAVETYQRRYLWITALELVEQDAFDHLPPQADVFRDIEDATSFDELKKVFSGAYKAASGDKAQQARIKAAYDLKKTQFIEEAGA